jgi:membrane-bound lytic murein transglycosylase B
VSILRRLLLCLVAASALAARAEAAPADPDFAAWLGGVRQEALASGIRPAAVAVALDGVQPIPRVIELDRRQPESTTTFAGYLRHVVNEPRRKAAREQLQRNRELLDAIAGRYHVQPRFIVALWGIETSFGRDMGGYPVIDALATLAYDGRRSDFFRGELMNALRIVDQDQIDPKTMLGSWAGAMGQTQFMPSSFLSYAVSYSGDGRRDIWHRREDVFASIANYLAQSGWNGTQGWGRAVRVPGGLDPALIGLNTKKTLSEWGRLGLRRADGGPLPRAAITASLLRPGNGDGPALLVYDNFAVLLKWNNSSYFAASVGYLADSME